MNSISTIISELRVLVGYLGEKGQANWWSSEFFSPSATSFLSPIFNRSLFLAQYQGSSTAAAKVHDEAIGVGRIYHLFRLPIGLEQASADAINDATFSKSLQESIANRDQAMRRLNAIATKTAAISSGPVSLGQMGDDLEAELKKAAGVYHSAFSQNIRSLPYLRETT